MFLRKSIILSFLFFAITFIAKQHYSTRIFSFSSTESYHLSSHKEKKIIKQEVQCKKFKLKTRYKGSEVRFVISVFEFKPAFTFYTPQQVTNVVSLFLNKGIHFFYPLRGPPARLFII